MFFAIVGGVFYDLASESRERMARIESEREKAEVARAYPEAREARRRSEETELAPRNRRERRGGGSKGSTKEGSVKVKPPRRRRNLGRCDSCLTHGPRWCVRIAGEPEEWLCAACRRARLQLAFGWG